MEASLVREMRINALNEQQIELETRQKREAQRKLQSKENSSGALCHGCTNLGHYVCFGFRSHTEGRIWLCECDRLNHPCGKYCYNLDCNILYCGRCDSLRKCEKNDCHYMGCNPYLVYPTTHCLMEYEGKLYCPDHCRPSSDDEDS